MKKKTPKPSKDGSWRITETIRWAIDSTTTKKHLCDNEQSFTRLMKHKKKYAMYRDQNAVTITVEIFDGHKWMVYSSWTGPSYKEVMEREQREKEEALRQEEEFRRQEEEWKRQNALDATVQPTYVTLPPVFSNTLTFYAGPPKS